MRVVFYTSASGRSPVLDYIEQLDTREQAKIFEALVELKQYGLNSIRMQFRQIETKLWEIKLAAHRIFYTLIQKDEIILLHAYRKQSQKLPLKERAVALKRMKEIL